MYHNGDIMQDDSLNEIIQRRQKARIFHRLVTGMYFHRTEQFRFMTLTSSPRSPSIRVSWRRLKSVIRSTCPIDFIEHLNEDTLGKFKRMTEPLKFEYCAIFTEEGEGVIHIVYVGDYIPFYWLQEKWMNIHKSYGVNIEAVRKYRGVKVKDKMYYPAGLASYVLNQYVANQDALRTMNWSRGWVYPGFVEDWTKLKRSMRYESKEDKIHEWHVRLDEIKKHDCQSTFNGAWLGDCS